MRFLHLSDLHLCSSPEAIIYGVNPYENLQKAIEKIQAIKDSIDLCVITGDISNDGSEESYELADKALSVLPFPVYVTNGNHDNYHNLMEHRHAKLLSKPIMSLQGIDFLFLNSIALAEDGSNRSKGFLNDRELERVKKVKDQKNPTILLMHHPVLTSSSWMDRRILINRETFLSVVASIPHIIAVLSGHNHRSFKRDIGPCLFSTSPSVSTSYSDYLRPYEEAHSPGFDILETDGNNVSFNTINTR